jgi:glucan phosphoethanolaminetransferase (alkaline phosphatase superfamily)
MLLSFPLAYVVVFPLACVVLFSFGLCCCLFLWLMLLFFPLAFVVVFPSAYVVVFSFGLCSKGKDNNISQRKRQQHKPKEKRTTQAKGKTTT